MEIIAETAVEAMDRFNALLQAELESSPPAVALELAQIKFVVNQWFDRRRRGVRE